MKLNEWDERGEMVEWNLWQEKTGETPRKTYPDPVSSTTKSTSSDQDADSGLQRAGRKRSSILFPIFSIKILLKLP